MGHWNCQSCGAAGRSLDSLYSRLGLVFEAEPTVVEDIYERVCNILNPNKKTNEAVKDIGLPEEYRPINEGSLARMYCDSRGITDKEIQDYELGYGIGKLDYRIIIPNRSNTGYDMWQGRDYHPTFKRKIKYWTPSGALDSLVLFNYIRASKYPVVLVCEGPISSIIAGPNAVASWGKHLSAAHIELLVKMRAQEYWICYDGDATLSGLASASTLYARGLTVRYLKLPPKDDPATYGREPLLKLGRDTKLFNEITPSLILAGAA
jgi:DNA primase